EALDLPAVVVRTALWESRFQRLADDGRKKCEDSVRVEVDERLKALQPRITTEILSRVRRLWQGLGGEGENGSNRSNRSRRSKSSHAARPYRFGSSRLCL